ncbi:MAG: hypothetical protein FWC02_01650 [Firmicutes bacterium]|nr:hypothetical protein [Bacillota bacterium]
MDMNITTNANQVTSDLLRVQQIVSATGSRILVVNNASANSFNRLRTTIATSVAVFGVIGVAMMATAMKSEILTEVTNTLNESLSESVFQAGTLGMNLEIINENLELFHELIEIGTELIDENVVSMEESAEVFGEYIIAWYDLNHEIYRHNALITDAIALREEFNQVMCDGLEPMYIANELACINTGNMHDNNDAVYDNTYERRINTYETDAGSDAYERNNESSILASLGLGALEAAQVALTFASAFNTVITLANNVVKLASEVAAKKAARGQVKAAKKKTGSNLALASSNIGVTKSKPFVGIPLGIAAIAAIAGGMIAMRSLMPAMATGGVVSAPTMTLVGEGRYPEAVVPLGSSPQFSSMKNDIAEAVMQGIVALNGNSGRRARNSQGSGEVVLNIDGAKLARVMLPNLASEQRRIGYSTNLREI